MSARRDPKSAASWMRRAASPWVLAAPAFSRRELGQVIAMALTIDALNRIGDTTRLEQPRG